MYAWYALKHGFIGFIDNFIRIFWISLYSLGALAVVVGVVAAVLGQNKKPIAKHVPHISHNSLASIHKKPTSSLQMFVRPSKLNVRETPSATAPIKIVLKRGEAVQVVSEDSGWSRISARLQPNLGWVRSKFLSTKRIVRRSQASRPVHQVPSLTELHPYELQFIKNFCLQDKLFNGQQNYNSCLQKQLASLAHGPRQPNLSQVEFFERQSITDTCLLDNLFTSVAAYNSCLQKQVAGLGNDPSPPDLSQLSAAERQSIEGSCLLVKLTGNPAAYNRCLLRRLRSHSVQD